MLVRVKDKNPGILLSPTADHVPSISKSNHVHVNLVMPPSPSDPEGPTCEMWFPLSTIPHACIAQLSEGNGGARMLKVLVEFWEKVVLPCIAEHCDIASTPFFATTVRGNTLRTATKGQPEGNLNRPKQLCVDPDIFVAIQQSMCDKVQRDPSLAVFKGFFFVVNLKGCKQSSSITIKLDDLDLPKSEGPLAKLERQFSELDFDYMWGRRNGELYLDLAISFHPDKECAGPRGPERMPLVGLWRQEWLVASYGVARFTMGKAHYANTLSRSVPTPLSYDMWEADVPHL
ncbi:hypothetical protein BOTBODRAFT_180456 [Botryobasidium botryosum FD-172 SS1]|uniref:Uncharacterized protein n=1 Tax=Botryobasidium botryosum (strain FD-172 SS1) TaxID=930990 RepID=A0A067LZG5_BOTB1|nr:hypothetical protein BOTBODRAFT_180456 [Botryobasidium botryosum FD-172 SS1]